MNNTEWISTIEKAGKGLFSQGTRVQSHPNIETTLKFLNNAIKEWRHFEPVGIHIQQVGTIKKSQFSLHDTITGTRLDGGQFIVKSLNLDCALCLGSDTDIGKVEYRCGNIASSKNYLNYSLSNKRFIRVMFSINDLSYQLEFSHFEKGIR